MTICFAVCTREEIEKFVRKFEPPPVVVWARLYVNMLSLLVNHQVEVQKRELTEEQLEELEGVMRIFDKDGVICFILFSVSCSSVIVSVLMCHSCLKTSCRGAIQV